MDQEYKYKRKYNPKSNRLENYNYSQAWKYFITICTKDREYFFWEIINWEMILNDIWRELQNEIENIPSFRRNVILDEYVIMPNHIHLLLFLEWNIWYQRSYKMFQEKNQEEPFQKKTFQRNVSTDRWKNEKYYSDISSRGWNLWNIIKLFKWYFSKNINRLQSDRYFAWQKNYYDRIVRNEDELGKIRKYILENPQRWEQDKDNPQNLLM